MSRPDRQVTAVRINFSAGRRRQPGAWRQDPAQVGRRVVHRHGSHARGPAAVPVRRGARGRARSRRRWPRRTASRTRPVALLRLAAGSRRVDHRPLEHDDPARVTQLRHRDRRHGRHDRVVAAPRQVLAWHAAGRGDASGEAARIGSAEASSTHVALLDDFAAAPRRRPAVPDPGEDGLAAQRVVEAVATSPPGPASRRRPVKPHAVARRASTTAARASRTTRRTRTATCWPTRSARPGWRSSYAIDTRRGVPARARRPVRRHALALAKPRVPPAGPRPRPRARWSAWSASCGWRGRSGSAVVWTAHNLYPHDRTLSPTSTASSGSRSCELATRDHRPLRRSRPTPSDGEFPPAAPIFVDPARQLHRRPAGVGHPGRRHARTLGHRASTTFVYGFIGNLLPYKGLEELIDAFRAIDPGDAWLLISGGRPPEYGDAAIAARGGPSPDRPADVRLRAGRGVRAGAPGVGRDRAAVPGVDDVGLAGPGAVVAAAGIVPGDGLPADADGRRRGDPLSARRARGAGAGDAARSAAATWRRRGPRRGGRPSGADWDEIARRTIEAYRA